MFRFCTFIAMLAAAVLMWQGLGYAETVQGRIVEINPNEKSLTINRFDAVSGQPQQLEMSIDNETQFQGGIASLDALKVGDEVMLEADQNFVTRQWTINAIKKGAAGTLEQQSELNQSSQQGALERDRPAGGTAQSGAAEGSPRDANSPAGAGTGARTPGGNY